MTEFFLEVVQSIVANAVWVLIGYIVAKVLGETLMFPDRRALFSQIG